MFHWGHCIVSQHQEMTRDPQKQQDKSHSVSHILSPLPLRLASHMQLSWLICAHSCPNLWTPDIMMAEEVKGEEGGEGGG